MHECTCAQAADYRRHQVWVHCKGQEAYTIFLVDIIYAAIGYGPPQAGRHIHAYRHAGTTDIRDQIVPRRDPAVLTKLRCAAKKWQKV